MRLTLLVAIWAALELNALATPSEDVTAARVEYARGEYQRTVAILTKLIYTERAPLPEEELQEAHLLLGTSYFFLDSVQNARQEFSALLAIDPDYQLDAVVTDAKLYAFYDSLRRELKAELDEVRRRKTLAQDRSSRTSSQVIITRTVRQATPTFAKLLGFGVPQLMNGEPGKGAFFLISQGALGGTSLGLFLYQAARFGFPTGHYDPDEFSEIQTLQVVQIGTGGLFLVLYLWSVYDAFQNDQQLISITREERPLIGPIIDPKAVGVVATWEF